MRRHGRLSLRTEGPRRAGALCIDRGGVVEVVLADKERHVERIQQCLSVRLQVKIESLRLVRLGLTDQVKELPRALEL
jgi:hypothetical protein